MSSYKRLKSVAHSLSHHSVSALSWLHPHLAEACENAGISNIELDLLGEPTLPTTIEASEPLTLAIQGLEARFKEMLEQEGFELSNLKQAYIEFQFNVKKWDYYTAECSTTLVTTDERTIKKGVNVRGNSVNA